MKKNISHFLSNLLSLILLTFFITPSCKKDKDLVKQTDTIFHVDTILITPRYPGYILAGQTSGTGILYIDIINDTLHCIGNWSIDSILIDLNNDTINDFKLELVNYNSLGAFQITHNLICIGNAELVNDSVNIIPLSLNDTINYNTGVDNVSALYYHSYFNGGNHYEEGLWKNVGYKYAGVRLMINQTIRYGWIGIEYIDQCNLVLHDFAVTSPL